MVQTRRCGHASTAALTTKQSQTRSNGGTQTLEILPSIAEFRAGFAGPKGGFTLSDASGGTNSFIYNSKSYMDFNATGSSNGDAEIKNVIQPSCPDGAMIKIPLGNISNYQTSADTRLAIAILGQPAIATQSTMRIGQTPAAPQSRLPMNTTISQRRGRIGPVSSPLNTLATLCR
jgi:hypothetical protein